MLVFLLEFAFVEDRKSSREELPIVLTLIETSAKHETDDNSLCFYLDILVCIFFRDIFGIALAVFEEYRIPTGGGIKSTQIMRLNVA